MRKINLKTKNDSKDNARKRGSSSQVSLIISIILLIITGVSYGGVWYLKDSQSKKIDTIKEEINSLKKSLDTNKEFRKVYDFQNRLLEADKLSKAKVIQTNLLNSLSGATMGSSSLVNLKVDVKDGLSDVTTMINVLDLAKLAEQINAYDAIDINKDAKMQNSSTKEGLIEATVKFKVKENKINTNQK